MKWSYWMALYLRTHCVARGLSPLSIAAYQASLAQFRSWSEAHGTREPDAVTARQVLEYLEHLRCERDNGASAVNRAVTILRSFYRAIVAMGHLEPQANPLAGFPRIKAAARKLPTILDAEEVARLLEAAAATPSSRSAIERWSRRFTAPASALASVPGFVKAASICARSHSLCAAKEDMSVLSPSTRRSLPTFASTSRCAVRSCPRPRSFDHDAARHSRAERSMNASAHLDGARDSPSPLCRIGCATRSPRTSCAKASTLSRFAISSDTVRSRVLRFICM